MKEQQQTNTVALEAAYRRYITKFIDEIKDVTKLREVYTYAQAFWLAESK